MQKSLAGSVLSQRDAQGAHAKDRQATVRSLAGQVLSQGSFNTTVVQSAKQRKLTSAVDVPRPVKGEAAFQIAQRAGIVTASGQLKSRYR